MKEMISRRSFLRVMGLGFGAAMLTACKTGTTDSPADSPAASVPAPDTPVPFLTEDEFPRLDGSTACIPLIAQIMADTTGMELEAAEDATEEAAVEDAEEPPQAVRAAAAPQTAAAARNERRVILRIMITPSISVLRPQDAAGKRFLKRLFTSALHS